MVRGNPTIASRAARALTLLVWAGVLFPGVAGALDGRIDYLTTQQQGRTAGGEYTTSSHRLDESLDQYDRLMHRLFLRTGYRYLDERYASRNDSLSTELDMYTHNPTLSLTYRGHSLRGGLLGSGFRRIYTGGVADRRDDRLDWDAWLQMGADPYRMQVRYSDSWTERRDVGGGKRQNRERNLNGSAIADWDPVGEFMFTTSYLDNHEKTTGVRTTQHSYGLRYRGDTRWQDGRGRASVEARTSRFEEKIKNRTGDGLALQTPLEIGYVLDDTPETLDPLEPQPTPLPALADLDRDTPTSLDIGDDATPVREYGGDYRNILVDFGDAQTIAAATLYVDRVVSFPRFLTWRVYVSDDPDANSWTPVPQAGYTAVYTERTDGRQAWEFTFSTPLDNRRYKFVDEKSGPVEPELFVTELELYAPAERESLVSDSVLWRHYVNGGVDYDLLSNLTVDYSLYLSDRRFEKGAANNVDNTIHRFGATWRHREWTLAASHDLNTVKTPDEVRTDLRGTDVSLTSSQDRDVRLRLIWNRVRDASPLRDRTTDDYAADVAWKAAPQLMVMQKVSRGVLDDGFEDLTSRSWASITILRGQARRSLSFDLRRTYRWVSREAGTGFAQFDDVDLTVRWSPFPLLSYTGQYRYERRTGSNTIWRNLVTWNPLSGGGVDLRFTLNDYEDTRSDTTQRGGSVAVIWRARSRLRLEGGLESQEYRREGERSTPLNTRFRATWMF